MRHHKSFHLIFGIVVQRETLPIYGSLHRLSLTTVKCSLEQLMVVCTMQSFFAILVSKSQVAKSSKELP